MNRAILISPMKEQKAYLNVSWMSQMKSSIQNVTAIRHGFSPPRWPGLRIPLSLSCVTIRLFIYTILTTKLHFWDYGSTYYDYERTFRQHNTSLDNTGTQFDWNMLWMHYKSTFRLLGRAGPGQIILHNIIMNRSLIQFNWCYQMIILCCHNSVIEQL